jgi:hypothetical protein
VVAALTSLHLRLRRLKDRPTLERLGLDAVVAVASESRNIPTQQPTSESCVPSRNPCDLSVDLDETLFGFGRELGAGLDGHMDRAAATLNRLAPITESAAVLKLPLHAGSFSLQRGKVRIAAVLLDRFRLELGGVSAQRTNPLADVSHD